MTPTRAWLRYWLPVGLWMIVIFLASTGLLSADNTSRVIGPVLRFFFPDIRPETIQTAQFVCRKAAHAAEYFVLALLVWRARRRPFPGDRRPWCWKEAGFAFAFAVLYAVSDEVHQAFEPARQGQVVDVLIDAAGAALGLVVARLALAGARKKAPAEAAAPVTMP